MSILELCTLLGIGVKELIGLGLVIFGASFLSMINYPIQNFEKRELMKSAKEYFDNKK